MFKEAGEAGYNLVEFLVVAALVVLSGFGVVFLETQGHGDATIAGALLDVIKVGFGAVVALAYSAKNLIRKDGQ